MPMFNVEVTMQVAVRLEADDRDEAEMLVADGLNNLDHSMFDSVDVEEITFDSIESEDEDAD